MEFPARKRSFNIFSNYNLLVQTCTDFLFHEYNLRGRIIPICNYENYFKNRSSPFLFSQLKETQVACEKKKRRREFSSTIRKIEEKRLP